MSNGDGLAELPAGFTITTTPQPVEAGGVEVLPPGFTIQQPERPTFGQRFARGAAQLTQQIMGELSAAAQGTSPIVRNIEGGLNRMEAPEEDQFLFAEQGVVRPGNVALQDPETGQVRVYVERPETAEGRLSGAGRVIGVGALASPVSRLPGGGPAPRGLSPERARQAVKRAVAARRGLPPPTDAGMGEEAAAEGVRAAARAQQAATPAAAEIAQDFAATGVDPTLGAVSQSRPAQMAENFLNESFFGSGQMQRARERSLAQTAAATERAARAYGSAETPTEAGRTLIRGAERFRNVFENRSREMYQRLGRMIPRQRQFETPRTFQALQGVVEEFDNPELGRQFLNQEFDNLWTAIDNAGGNLSYNDLSRFRTRIGERLRSPVVPGQETVPRRDLERLYAGLTDDIFAAANSVSPEAGRLARRANDYTRGGYTRIRDSLDALLRPGANEIAVYDDLLRTAGEKGARASINKLRRIKRSLTRDEWGEVSSALIRQLGIPPPSMRQGLGQPNFSVNTFMTNYEKLLGSGADDVLFSGPGQAELKRGLDRLVNVINAQKNVEKLANPSGTGRIVNTALGLGALGSLATGQVVLGVLSGLAPPTAAALITNPSFVRWASRWPVIAKRGGRMATRRGFNRNLTRHIAELRQMGRQDPTFEGAFSQVADAVNEARESVFAEPIRESERATRPETRPR